MSERALETEQADTSDARQDAPKETSMRFVGIGASAGGLEAVSLLAKNLPQQANAVYVIAQHMSPKHKSVLSTLISRETVLSVRDLEQETVPQPNTIYVTPPNTDVVYEQGLLRLREPSGHPASPKPSADRLFKSLAREFGETCVGIVLSGTGSDGSYGVQAIREAGGITISQDPGTAKYDGMPTSAIETGCVDLTLSPEQIGTHLEKILARPRDFDALRRLMDKPNPLGELFGILLARTQVDFADYKENTLNRRISRRMTALDIDDYDRYVDYCRTNADEVDALHRDLLISVTRFFRDPDQFTKLRKELIALVARRQKDPIRVWIVGCATGEEAYSIAIMLADLLGGLNELARRNVQVFATDIDQNAVEIARRGVYPITAAQDIPQEFMGEYFTVSEGELSVRPELRAVTLFSHHNVFQDPPFINVDLVSIRNVLIYFNLALQERVLSRLHYAMAAGGLLFLGTSETVGEMGVYFEARQDSEKVFAKRRGVSGELKIEPGQHVYHRQRNVMPGYTAGLGREDGLNSHMMSLARSVAPNGAICTRSGRIVEVLGDISPYIEIRAGVSTSLNIKMLVEPLRTELSSLIAVALRNEARRDGRWHEVSLPIGNRVQLQVFPFASQQGGEMQCLVGIQAKFEENPVMDLGTISDDEQRAYVERMELEIRSTQEALQQTIEELQTTNEELQATNEEMQSTNEEFQATNEELETSNEELQSTNEELLTVNEELQISSAERQALASELEATMVSAPYVVALADQALMVRRMSRVALDFFGLPEIPPTGIHLSQCKLPEGFPSLAPLASSVLRLQEVRRIPIPNLGKYYNLVVSPVRDQHLKLIGVAITVAQYDNEPLSRILELVGEATEMAYWTFDLPTGELFWSGAMRRYVPVSDESSGPTWDDMNRVFNLPEGAEDQQPLQMLIDKGGRLKSDHSVNLNDGRTVTLRSRVMALLDDTGHTTQLVGLIHDVGLEEERDVYMSHFDIVQSELGWGFFSLDVAKQKSTWTRSLYDVLGHDPTTYVPSVDSALEMIHPDDRERVGYLLDQALLHGEPFLYRARALRADGCEFNAESRGSVRFGSEGEVSHVYGSFRNLDVS